jgi:hypothetical protein
MAPGTFDVPETDLGRVVLTAPIAFLRSIFDGMAQLPLSQSTPPYSLNTRFTLPIKIGYTKSVQNCLKVLVLAEEGLIL